MEITIGELAKLMKEKQEQDIKVACEFIKTHLNIVREDIAYTDEEFIKDFIKYMKER